MYIQLASQSQTGLLALNVLSLQKATMAWQKYNIALVIQCSYHRVTKLLILKILHMQVKVYHRHRCKKVTLEFLSNLTNCQL